MPTYEYRCAKCKKTFDKLQSMNDKPLAKCLLCGAAKPERLIGAGAGLIFKGSGFYITDYKNKSSSFPSKDDKGGSTSAKDKKDPAPAKPAKKDPPAAKSDKD